MRVILAGRRIACVAAALTLQPAPAAAQQAATIPVQVDTAHPGAVDREGEWIELLHRTLSLGWPRTPAWAMPHLD